MCINCRGDYVERENRQFSFILGNIKYNDEVLFLIYHTSYIYEHSASVSYKQKSSPNKDSHSPGVCYLSPLSTGSKKRGEITPIQVQNLTTGKVHVKITTYSILPLSDI